MGLVRISAAALIGTGLCLCLSNAIGFVHYRTIESTPADSRRTLSEAAFWRSASRQPGERAAQYVERLTSLVNDRIVHIDPVHTKPTFFENYILWGVAQSRGYYEWVDAKRAVRVGGGFCSQHAIVLNNILREAGIESRIIGLNGHVLNEALIDGEWRVYDPDFGVLLHEPLRELEANPRKVYEAYLDAGVSEATARHLQTIFATDSDNWHFRSTTQYKGVGAVLLEGLSYYLIWFLPAGLIVLGAGMMLMARSVR